MKMKKLLLFLALVPSVCFAQDAAHKAVAEQLNPYVYKILIDDNVNATLMITPQGALLFDTGFKESVGALSETIKQITELPLKGIVNTHYHYDHVGGNAVLGKGLEIAATAFTMGKVGGEGKPNSLIPDNPMVFKGGHTAEDFVVPMKDFKIAILGDLLFADRFPYIDIENGGNALKYLDIQSELIKMLPEDMKLIGGHGRLYTMEEFKKLHEDLQATVDIINQLIMADESLENIKAAKPLADYSKYDWDFVNQDKWIELVYNSIR